MAESNYSLRDRSLTKRETTNVKQLGGDGGGMRRSPRHIETATPNTNSRDYRYNQRIYLGGKIPNPLYYRDIEQNKAIRDTPKMEHKSRKHFDSSSDSSESDDAKNSDNDNNMYRTSIKNNRLSKDSGTAHSRYKHSHDQDDEGYLNNNTNGQQEDSQFQHHEENRLQHERDSIQPINNINSNSRNKHQNATNKTIHMGGSIIDQPNRRDLLRADVLPVAVDMNIEFSQLGGLDKHILALKEMVVLPLLYPDVFEKFRTQPPRGVLFVGPPGTGKTLTARALANSLSQTNGTIGNKQVSFFMRKGADCLSKWVGEGERQLRLLFEQV